jgi:hypothetical protein
LLLEFRDELLLHPEDDIRVDVPGILFEQVRDERLMSRSGNIEMDMRGPEM